MKHEVRELVLDNGARGLLINVADASVMSFNISFRAGEFLVPEAKWETPHVMEHLLLGANKDFPKARDFQAEFEKNGAYSNASTSATDITYEAECADIEWQRILDCMILAITKPLFLEDEFKAEMGNVKEELSSRANNHFQRLSLSLREAYGFRSTTYQKRLKLLKNVSLADTQNHYKATHTTSNMRFVVAGKITPTRKKHIKDTLEKMSLPKGRGRKAPPVYKPKGLDAPLYIANNSVRNHYFYLDTFRNDKLDERHRDALNLVDTTLTGTLYSRILGTAREKGLVYGMSSGVGWGSDFTNWWFGAQVRPDNAPALFDIIISELQKVLAGDLTAEDIEAAKQYSIGRFQRSAQTVSGLAEGYMSRYFYDDHVDDFSQIPARIKAVTKRDIVEGANQLFEQKSWGLGILGGKKDGISELYDQLGQLWGK